MTSHIRKEPHFGLGRLKHDPDLQWLFCESDAALGMRSNMGGQMDMFNLGVVLQPAQVEQTPNIAAAAKLRRVLSRFFRLARYHQQVLMIWYTRRQLNGKAIVSDTEVAAAHKEWMAL